MTLALPAAAAMGPIMVFGNHSQEAAFCSFACLVLLILAVLPTPAGHQVPIGRFDRWVARSLATFLIYALSAPLAFFASPASPLLMTIHGTAPIQEIVTGAVAAALLPPVMALPILWIEWDHTKSVEAIYGWRLALPWIVAIFGSYLLTHATDLPVWCLYACMLGAGLGLTLLRKPPLTIGQLKTSRLYGLLIQPTWRPGEGAHEVHPRGMRTTFFSMLAATGLLWLASFKPAAVPSVALLTTLLAGMSIRSKVTPNFAPEPVTIDQDWAMSRQLPVSPLQVLDRHLAQDAWTFVACVFAPVPALCLSPFLWEVAAAAGIAMHIMVTNPWKALAPLTFGTRMAWQEQLRWLSVAGQAGAGLVLFYIHLLKQLAYTTTFALPLLLSVICAYLGPLLLRVHLTRLHTSALAPGKALTTT